MVRWRESIEWLAGNGVTTLVEVGSGKVLTGLAKRIAPSIEGISVGTPAEIDAVVAKLA